MENDIQDIIDHCYEFAEDLLNETGEFHPYAVTIDNDGNFRPVGYQGDEDITQKSGEVLEVIHQYCEEQLVEGTIRAYGLTYEASIQLEEGGEETDAVIIDIVHSEFDSIPLYCFPYKVLGKGIVQFGESFAIRREDV